MWLVIRTGPQQGRTVPVSGDRFLIGRDEGCDLVLAEELASRQHAVLERGPDGRTILRDLGSTNGTLVDGVRLMEPRELVGGEQIQIGSTVLLTSAHEPSGQPTGARPIVTAPVPPRLPGPATTERMILRRGVRRATVLAAVASVVAVAVILLFVTGVLPPGEAGVADIVDQVEPSTVQVVSQVDGEPQGAGTGWVLDGGQGLIVTNQHVVNAGTDWVVVALGRERPAELIGAAPCEDLAVLRVQDRTGLETLPMGTQAELEEGDSVVVVGFPGSLARETSLTATEGIVSVVKTNFNGAYDVPNYSNLIQTDAAINPGNSGGPMVNLDAELVGVNSAGITLLGGRIIQGQGYAIGVDRVRQIVPLLSQRRSLGWTGMGLENPDPNDPAAHLSSLGLPAVPGLIVQIAVPGSPAAAAGFGQRPALITAVNGTEMDGSLPTYCEVVDNAERGQTATFTVVEAGSNQATEVEVPFG
ncbi:MAG TPA: trypsin-like peptidase domain-containing protein [Actinomycetota bacterium]|nr:trypsin-like peptidase domain-containing protein [Actinomycetota bacterium]